jgi:hypothetical protein
MKLLPASDLEVYYRLHPDREESPDSRILHERPMTENSPPLMKTVLQSQMMPVVDQYQLSRSAPRQEI